MEGEKRQQSSLSRASTQELGWVRSNAKGPQKKGKARMRRYEDLVDPARAFSQEPYICPSLLGEHRQYYRSQ